MPLSPSAPTNLSTWSPQNLGAVLPVVTSGITDPLGGSTAYQVVFPAVGAGEVSQVFSPNTPQSTTGESYDFTVWMRCAAGPTDVNIWVWPGAWLTFGMTARVTVTATWQKFSVRAICSQVTRLPVIGTRLKAGAEGVVGQAPTSAATIEVWQPLVTPTPVNLLEGLVGYYRFDGNGNDATGVNNGIPTDITYASGSVNQAALGQAAVFNGSSSIVTLPAASFRSKELTVSLWVKTLSATEQTLFLSWFGTPSFQGYVLQLTASGAIRVIHGNGGGGFGIFGPYLSALNDGAWHHFCLVGSREKAWAHVYVDTFLAGSVGGDLFAGPNTSTQAGFGDLFDVANLSGAMDEAAIYNRPISVQEIQALFNNGIPPEYPFSGGAPANSPPVVSNLVPSAGTTIGKTTPLQFDVTDVEGFGRVRVMGQYVNGDYDVIYDGTGFASKYSAFSTVTAIANGFRFVVRPTAGWINGPVTIRADASDVSGGENT